jgi:N-methylhydantoinase A
MPIRAATDVGGTFTDLVYYEVDAAAGRGGTVRTAKVDTTPPGFEVGVMKSLQKGGVCLADMVFFAHGSTVIVNAITERRGVRVGLVTTQGFRDVLEIGRGNRPDLFNFNFKKPPPFVERHLRAELRERTNYKGEIELSADEAAIPAVLDCFRTAGVQAIAVCFLHAYRNPANEVAVTRRIRELWPGISVLASHELSREWREYERTSTTVLSAYVHPIAQRYIQSLESELKAGGYAGRPYIMLSNGGITTVAQAKANPIAMVESGPASGIYAAAHLGRVIGQNNLIVLDIGGTTAKCTVVEDGEVRITTDYFIERTRSSPGYPIQTPVSEIVEIGNGGGSIAWVDTGGKLHVGPQSAGARPGPVAYGRGGTEPTTTDANLFLGRIDAAAFGGGIRPDWDGIHQAFQRLADQLGVSAVEAARGVIRIANANMTNALRLVSTNKGHDPRDFALMAFGGGGPMHAVALAEELGIPRVIVPVHSSVFSAWGMLLTDLRSDYLQTRVLGLDEGSGDTVLRQFREMELEAASNASRDGTLTAPGSLTYEYLVDMRYEGQEHTVKVPVEVGRNQLDVAATIDRFHTLHEKRYTYWLPNPVQIVSFHLVACVAVPKPELARRAATGRSVVEAIIGRREVDFDAHGIHEATIYDGLRLGPGMVLGGPAVVQEPMVTLVVPPGNRVTVDEFGNYHVALGVDSQETP